MSGGSIVTQGYASSGPDSPGNASVNEVVYAEDSSSAVLGCEPVMMFRMNHPAFANSNAYPDRMVQFYLWIGRQFVDCFRWGEMAEFGRELAASHFLALEKQAASNPRGIPGTVIGVLNSGSVDKVSYGRDVASIMEDGAGHWGLTTYGMIYLRTARMMGAGPVQIGACGPSFRDPAAYLPQSAVIYSGNYSQAELSTLDEGWQGPMAWNGAWNV